MVTTAWPARGRLVRSSCRLHQEYVREIVDGAWYWQWYTHHMVTVPYDVRALVCVELSISSWTITLMDVLTRASTTCKAWSKQEARAKVRI